MPDLLVRDIDESLIDALEERARRNGRSVAAEHRLILMNALTQPVKCSFAELLAAMPEVGDDEDFARVQRDGSAVLRSKK